MCIYIYEYSLIMQWIGVIFIIYDYIYIHITDKAIYIHILHRHCTCLYFVINIHIIVIHAVYIIVIYCSHIFI